MESTSKNENELKNLFDKFKIVQKEGDYELNKMHKEMELYEWDLFRTEERIYYNIKKLLTEILLKYIFEHPIQHPLENTKLTFDQFEYIRQMEAYIYRNFLGRRESIYISNHSYDCLYPNFGLKLSEEEKGHHNFKSFITSTNSVIIDKINWISHTIKPGILI